MASQALNETRLPRAVLQRSAAIQARIDARTEPKAASADDAPPVIPSADDATPVDPNNPPAPPVDPRENDPAYWKQRFKVTQGVLTRERTERTEGEREFNRRLTELQDQIRTLQASTPAAPEELDVSAFLTPEQVESLGEEEAKTIVKTAVDAARRTARQLVDAELQPLREQRATAQATTVRDQKAEFTDKLAELVPDFEEIDTNEGWNAWLAQDDEATGMQRQLLLDHHVGKLDAKKTAAMFDTYKKVAQLPQPPVVPNGNGAVPPGVPPSQVALKPLTQGEIKDFYKRSALGKVKEAERLTFEARRKLRAGG
jgi:hypothetical protein